MRYLRVCWNHAHSDEPVMLYSELDDRSWEVRKVEVFADGSMGFAGKGESTGSTVLGTEPVPPIEEIAADPQFQPEEISRGEFERVWKAAHQVTHHS